MPSESEFYGHFEVERAKKKLQERHEESFGALCPSIFNVYKLMYCIYMIRMIYSISITI